MGAYFFRRILIAIPVLLGITIAGFFVLAAAPGDPLLAAKKALMRVIPDSQFPELAAYYSSVR